MSKETIVAYACQIKLDAETADIGLRDSNGGSHLIRGLTLETAALTIDLLRNEEPIAYDTDSKVIATGSWEGVGEQEG